MSSFAKATEDGLRKKNECGCSVPRLALAEWKKVSVRVRVRKKSEFVRSRSRSHSFLCVPSRARPDTYRDSDPLIMSEKKP